MKEKTTKLLLTNLSFLSFNNVYLQTTVIWKINCKFKTYEM